MWSVKQHNKYPGSKLISQHLLNLPTTTNKSQQIILYYNIPINGYIYIYILSIIEAVTASFLGSKP